MRTKVLKRIKGITLCFIMVIGTLLTTTVVDSETELPTVTVNSYNVATKKEPFYAQKKYRITNNKVNIPLVGGGDFKVHHVEIGDNKEVEYDNTGNNTISVDISGFSNIQSIDVYYEAKELDNFREDVTFYDYSVIGEKDSKDIRLDHTATMTFTYNGITYTDIHAKYDANHNTNTNLTGFFYSNGQDTGLNFSGEEKLTNFSYKLTGEDNSEVYKSATITFPPYGYWNMIDINITLVTPEKSCLNAGVNQFDDTLSFGQTGFSDKEVYRYSATGNRVDINVNNAAGGEAHYYNAIIPGLFDEMKNRTLNDPGFFTDTETTWKKVYDNYELNFYRNGHEYELISSTNKDTEATRLAFDRSQSDSSENNYGVKKDFFPLNDQEWEDTYEKVKSLGFDGPDGVLTTHSPASEGKGDNCFFGMKYDLYFTIGDYEGPMEFRFAGDDDLWVVLDDETTILDLGGMHQAYPQAYIDKGDLEQMKQNAPWYVDIREALEKKYENDENKSDKILNKKHKISVYYMERGGWDSSCYMKFILPNATPIQTNTGDIQFEKVNENDDLLEGVGFGLYQDENATENPIKTATSSKEGTVTFENLEPGTYYVKEISTLDGYELDETVYTATVKAGYINNLVDENGVEITEVINRSTHNKGSITISKQDGNGKALEGAGFTLYVKDDSSGSETQVGQEQITKLVMEVSINNNDQKYDASTNRYIDSDKEYIVHKTEDNNLFYFKELTDDEKDLYNNGQLNETVRATVEFNIDDLSKQYSIEETTVPYGYVQNGELNELKNKQLPLKSGETDVYDILYSVTNYKELDIPNTGQYGISMIVIPGMIFIILGAYYLFKNRRHKTFD